MFSFKYLLKINVVLLQLQPTSVSHCYSATQTLNMTFLRGRGQSQLRTSVRKTGKKENVQFWNTYFKNDDENCAEKKFSVSFLFTCKANYIWWVLLLQCPGAPIQRSSSLFLDLFFPLFCSCVCCCYCLCTHTND